MLLRLVNLEIAGKLKGYGISSIYSRCAVHDADFEQHRGTDDFAISPKVSIESAVDALMEPLTRSRRE